ncbi:hypothetical protein D3C86_2115610 [compost metagenome]
MQTRSPYLQLFEQPLVGFRFAAIAIDHHLLSHAAYVWAKHGMQPHNGAAVRRQHGIQRAIFYRGQINQNTVRRQRR